MPLGVAKFFVYVNNYNSFLITVLVVWRVYGAAGVLMLVVLCCSSLRRETVLGNRFLKVVMLGARAVMCAAACGVLLGWGSAAVSAQSIFDVPKDMADNASGQAIDILRHYQGEDAPADAPLPDEPVDVSLDVSSVKTALPAGRSFVVGPVFNAIDQVKVQRRAVVPQTAEPMALQGVIIAPDVSFVDMADADMFFDFVQKNLMQSVIVIGFRDFDDRSLVPVGEAYVGRSMTKSLLQGILTEVQGYVRATKGYERASVYIPKQNAPDGVLNVVIKKSGLTQRDIHHARFYEAAPIVAPSRRPVIPVPVRKAAVPESFLEVLGDVARYQKEDAPSAGVDVSMPTGLERTEPDKIPVGMPELPDAVEPVLPTVQGFILVVDEAFVGMDDLKNFYAFNRDHTGQVMMPVGVEPRYVDAVTSVLHDAVGRKLTEGQLERITHSVRERIFGVLREETPSYETVKTPYFVSLPEQSYEDGVVYLVIR